MGVTHNTGVILEVEEDTIGTSPWLGLADDDGWHDLLSQFWLSLLDGGHDHVSNTSGWETVQACSDTLDGNDVQVASAGVVTAVHDGTTIHLVSIDVPFFLASSSTRPIFRSSHMYVYVRVGSIVE